MTVHKSLINLSKDTLIYGLGGALQAFVGFLLFPVYTRVLSQKDFGVQDLLMSFIAVLTFFIVLGLDSGAARYYFDTSVEEQRHTYLSSWLWFEVALSILLVIVLILSSDKLCALLFNNVSLAPAFRLGLAAIPFMVTIRVINLTLRLTFQSRLFSVLTVLSLIVQAVMAILFVAVFKMGVSGVFGAILISNILQMLIGIGFTYRILLHRLRWDYLRSMLIFGLPLVPSSISLWILNYSNRYFLARLTSLSDLGLFSAGIKVAAVLSVVITAFQNAWPPFAFSLLSDDVSARNIYAKTLNYFLLVTILIGTSISLFGREILLVLTTPEYESAYRILPWLIYTNITWGIVGIVGIACEIAKKSYQITVAVVLGALVTTILNIILIPRGGVTGGALAMMIGNCIALAYIYIVGQKYFFVPYELPKLFRAVLLSAFALFIGLIFDAQYDFWKTELLVIKIAIFLFFIAFLFIMRIVVFQEIKKVIAMVKR